MEHSTVGKKEESDSRVDRKAVRVHKVTRSRPRTDLWGIPAAATVWAAKGAIDANPESTVGPQQMHYGLKKCGLVKFTEKALETVSMVFRLVVDK